MSEEYKFFYLELEMNLGLTADGRYRLTWNCKQWRAVLCYVEFYVLFTPTTIIYDRDWRFDNLIAEIKILPKRSGGWNSEKGRLKQDSVRQTQLNLFINFY